MQVILPEVISVSVSDGAENVATDTTVSAIFSESMDPATINTTTFTLKGPDGESVARTVTYEKDLNLARFTPQTPLSYSTSYIATLTTGIKDLTGNTFKSPYTWGLLQPLRMRR
jgi:hypothetical protein